MSNLEAFAELCRWCVLATLLFAAAAKTRGFAAFRESIADGFPRLSRHAGVLATLVVAVEWGIGVAILAGGGALWPASLAASLLFCGFAAVIALALARGDSLVCSCFGAGGRQVGVADLVRGLVLAMAAACASSYAPVVDVSLIERAMLAGLGIAFVLPTVWLREALWLLRARPGERA